MKIKTFLFCLLVLLLAGFLGGMLLGIASITKQQTPRPALGDVQTFEAAYRRWKAAAESNGGTNRLVLSLGHFKGLSSQSSKARGRAVIDLADGALTVEVSGLPERRDFDVWLVHNQPGPGKSVKPEAGDRMIHAGNLVRQGDLAILTTRLDRKTVAGFTLDLMVIVPRDADPAVAGVLFGAPSLFQKIFYSTKTTEKLLFTRLDHADDDSAAKTLAAPFRSLVPTLAHADQGGLPNLVSLLARGERLFFEERFAGNGRTCGSCHPAENNFTIDPAFIATLPANDPLFVAEFNDHLNAARNGGRQFENPELLRRFGLILENVDGFDDLANKFVMRGTPHTFAQALSIEPAPANPFIPGSTTPFDGTSGTHRTGWSGDGAPGEASLREFAIGAVTQHFTQTLNRVAGVDFRLPNDAELDAMEAFLLSLGRRAELDLSALQSKLIDADVVAGLALFNNGSKGKCALCHFNAGANQGIFAPFGRGNVNFNTGVEARAASLGLLGANRPVDGGFGRGGSLANGFGNGTFNTPPLVEAADKKTFFHNNLCNTIECAVEFYTTTEFNDSPSGLLLRSLPPFLPLSLGQDEVFQVAAFLRAINALENIRAATEKLLNGRAQIEASGDRSRQSQRIFKLASADIKDAYRVLNQGRDPQFKPEGLYPGARRWLEYAGDNCDMVGLARSKAERDYLIAEALSALATAKIDIVKP
jgi:cytochrome c peroxidase